MNMPGLLRRAGECNHESDIICEAALSEMQNHQAERRGACDLF
jgi:hypothetical protein